MSHWHWVSVWCPLPPEVFYYQADCTHTESSFTLLSPGDQSLLVSLLLRNFNSCFVAGTKYHHMDLGTWTAADEKALQLHSTRAKTITPSRTAVSVIDCMQHRNSFFSHSHCPLPSTLSFPATGPAVLVTTVALQIPNITLFCLWHTQEHSTDFSMHV